MQAQDTYELFNFEYEELELEEKRRKQFMKLDRSQIEADFRALIGPLCDAVGPSGVRG